MRAIVRTMAAVTALALAAGAPASAMKLRGFVVATGGGSAAASGMKMTATAGQSAVGRSTQGTRAVAHGYWYSGGANLAGVDDGPPAPGLPRALAFGPPSPNPSPGAVAFAIALPRAARVDLDVLDAQGRRVTRVSGGSFAAGTHRLAWDGRNAAGQRVAAGVFFARLEVDGRPQGVRRVILAR